MPHMNDVARGIQALLKYLTPHCHSKLLAFCGYFFLGGGGGESMLSFNTE